MTASRKPYVLIVLDGFGHSDNPDSNAIMAARKPNWDRLLQENPNGLISGSGEDVGLPEGQMGNSEVGHMNLGAGRVVYQDFTRITKAIRDGDFFSNSVITGTVDKAVAAGRAVHVLGLFTEQTAPVGTEATLLAQALDFTEAPDLNSCGTVTIDGGYSPDFAAIVGTTIIHGNLTIRDKTRPVTVHANLELTGSQVKAAGQCQFKQTEFGIRPVTAGLGTVRVQDQITVTFQVVARQAQESE